MEEINSTQEWISDHEFAFPLESLPPTKLVLLLLALMNLTGYLCRPLVDSKFCNIVPIDGSNCLTSLHLPHHCTWEVQT